MSFNLKWVYKRARNSDYQYIVLRKNFRVIKTLITIHHLNTVGIFKNKYKSCKLVVLNMYEIFLVMNFLHITLPFWFIKFIKPFFIYPSIQFHLTYADTRLLKSMTVYSSTYQCKNVLNRKNWEKLNFFRSRFVLRLWMNVLHNKLKLTTNVKLYKKTV